MNEFNRSSSLLLLTKLLLTLIGRIDGRKERVQFDKITARVSRLCYGLDPEHVDAAAITQKVISGVYQGVGTIELDNLVRMVDKTPNLEGQKKIANAYTATYIGCGDCGVHDRHTS